MKRIFLLIAFLLVAGCGQSTEEIANTTKKSMQNTLNTDAKFKELSLRVEKVSVLEVGSNQYKGFAEVVTRKGSKFSVVLAITADKDNVMWETSPGAFMPAFQELIQDQFKEAEKELLATPTVLTKAAPSKYSPPTKKSWAVQVASFQEIGKAVNLADNITSSNYPAFIKTSGGVNRVYIGPYQTKKEADSTAYIVKQQKLQGFVVEYRPD